MNAFSQRQHPLSYLIESFSSFSSPFCAFSSSRFIQARPIVTPQHPARDHHLHGAGTSSSSSPCLVFLPLPVLRLFFHLAIMTATRGGRVGGVGVGGGGRQRAVVVRAKKNDDWNVAEQSRRRV